MTGGLADSPLAKVGESFVLAGREAELDRLVELYEGFAAGELTEPHVVSLEGRSGYGKSRLVQELYRRIAADQDYWPKSLVEPGHGTLLERRKSLGFTASSSAVRRHAKHDAEIPFIWLAIDCDRTKTGHERSSLLELMEDLEARFPDTLAGVNVKAEAAEESGTFALEKLIEAGDYLPGDVPGLGTLKAGVKLAWKVREKRRRRREERGTGEVDAYHGKGLELVGLLRLLQKRRRRLLRDPTFRQRLPPALLRGDAGPPLPIVLVIEDAHHADEAILEALAAMVSGHEPGARPAQRRRMTLPLLVIATAWPEEIEAQATSDLPRYADVLAGTTPVAPGEAVDGPVERRRIGSLPAAALRQMVLDVAPATAPRVVEDYVAHVRTEDGEGGNPLHLALLLQHEVTIDSLRDGAITATTKAIEGLPKDVDEAFGALWNRMGADVQNLLALASMQGPAFHAASALACASLVPMKADPGAVMTEAEASHHWVRPASDVLLTFLERYCFQFADRHARAWSHDRREEVAVTVCGSLVDALRDRSLPPADRRRLLEIHVALVREWWRFDIDVDAAAASGVALLKLLNRTDRYAAVEFFYETLVWLRLVETRRIRRPAYTRAFVAAMPDVHDRGAVLRAQREHVDELADADGLDVLLARIDEAGGRYDFVAVDDLLRSADVSVLRRLADSDDVRGLGPEQLEIVAEKIDDGVQRLRLAYLRHHNDRWGSPHAAAAGLRNVLAELGPDAPPRLVRDVRAAIAARRLQLGDVNGLEDELRALLAEAESDEERLALRRMLARRLRAEPAIGDELRTARRLVQEDRYREAVRWYEAAYGSSQPEEQARFEREWVDVLVDAGLHDEAVAVQRRLLADAGTPVDRERRRARLARLVEEAAPEEALSHLEHLRDRAHPQARGRYEALIARRSGSAQPSARSDEGPDAMVERARESERRSGRPSGLLVAALRRAGRWDEYEAALRRLADWGTSISAVETRRELALRLALDGDAEAAYAALRDGSPVRIRLDELHAWAAGDGAEAEAWGLVAKHVAGLRSRDLGSRPE